MNKKKLCAGTLALALSLGGIAPAISTSYATDLEIKSDTETQTSETTIENKVATAESAPLTADQKKAQLQNYVNEKEAVKKSPKYINAASFEQDSYIEAVDTASAALNANNLNGIDQLIKNVEDAKLNLGANLIATAPNRDALRMNIALANNLYKQMAYSSTGGTLKDAIDVANKTLSNPDLLENDLIKANETLSKAIETAYNDKKDSVDIDKTTLTADDIKKLTENENETYAKAIAKLYDLHNNALTLTEGEPYKQLNNKGIKDDLVKYLNQSAASYQNTTSTTEDINNAYKNLNLAYNSALTAINSNDSEVERLKSKLSTMVNEEYDNFTKGSSYAAANKLTQSVYNGAVSRAKSVLEAANPSQVQLEEAIRNVATARLAVQPVKTQTLGRPNGTNNTGGSNNNSSNNHNNNNQTSTKLNELNTLLSEATTIKGQDAYKNAKEDKKTAYDSAISSGKTIKAKTNPAATEKEITEAVAAIKAAKDGLTPANTDSNEPISEDVKKARKDLDTLASKRESVQQSDSYKKATNSQKTAYRNAINDARNLLTDYANKTKTPNLEDINKAKKAITDAITAMGYVESVKYPTNIDDLLAEAESFKSTPNYLAKKGGSKEDRDLVTTYDDLIKEATRYKNTANPKAEILSQYVDRINEIKKTINNEMSYDELSLRSYIRQAEMVMNSADYNNVLQARRDSLKKAYDKAKELVDSGSLTKEKIQSAVSDLEAALRPDDIQKILNKGNDDKKAVSKKYDVRNMSLEELIELATKVVEHPNYNYSDYKLSTSNALSRAKQANLNGTDKEKEEARKDLVSYLIRDDMQALIERIRDTEGTNLSEPDYVRELKELVNYAQKVMDAEGYYKIPSYKRDSLYNNHRNGVYNIKIGSKAAIVENIKALRETLSDEDIKPYLDKLGLKLSDIKPFTENTGTDDSKPNTKDLSELGLDKLIELANKVKNHADYKQVGQTQKKSFEEALEAAKNAKSDEEKKEARTALISALNQSEIKLIVAKVRNNEAGESANLKELKDLIVFAGKVIDHTDYTNVDKDLRDQLAKALISAKQAVESNDEIKIAAAKAELNRLLSDERLADIVKAIKEGNKDLTSRQIIEKIIAEDAEFRKTDKFKRAKKDLKKTYIEALTKASEVAKNTNASEDDLKVASDALIAAKNALDGDQFAARLKALKEKYEKEKAKITDANKKAEIEKLIAGLDSEDASMDELIAAETVLSNALPKGTVEVTTTPSTTTTTTTTPVPTTTTTTTPVTTTSTVPSTVTPGSIVRTGIKSLIGVVILLAVAVGAFVITGKNKDNKNKNKRTFESDSSKKEN